MPLRRRAAKADRHTFELVDDGFADDVDADPVLDLTTPPDARLDDPRHGHRPGDRRPDPADAEVGMLGVAQDVGAHGLDATQDPHGLEVHGLDGGGRDDGSLDDGDDDPGADDGPLRKAARRRRRRVVAASVVGVVVVLGGMATVDAAQSRADLARLREAPGGVAPMLAAPDERWSVEGTVPGALDVVAGAVVTVQDDDVVAHDLATGAERWRTEAGDAVYCGSPFGYRFGTSTATSDEVVCLVGFPDTTPAQVAPVASVDPPVAREVLVLGADGAVLARRALDAADGVAAPGPDGSLVRTLRVGEVPAEHGAELDMDETTGVPADVPVGRDVVVVLEDAVTGEERWRHELPFADDGGWRCVTWSDVGDGARSLADLENLWGSATGGVVQVDGCGVSAWFAPDGTRLDDPAAPADAVVRLPDGSFYRDATGQMGWSSDGAVPEDHGSATLAPDGSVRWEPPGPLFLPWASDGYDLDVRLLREQGVVAAHGAEGGALWSAPDAGIPDEVLAVAGGAVVLSRADGLVALDVGTGRQRWAVEEAELRDPDEPEEAGALARTTAFTDGEHVIVGTQDWSGRDQHLVAVDLADGDVVWRTDLGENAWPLAVQGALLVVDERSVTRLG
ncbi:PQQ-binding-like beta-propeller repeat protein [Cellulosimicrobium sp. NPDC057127]|uniref:outer membrane protein assembly factor BamB family protein n=1 Tax=Cellulosimicrobium sp. NPDC057127 TaxID=3346026 RepID=UPI003632BC84